MCECKIHFWITRKQFKADQPLFNLPSNKASDDVVHHDDYDLLVEGQNYNRQYIWINHTWSSPKRRQIFTNIANKWEVLYELLNVVFTFLAHSNGRGQGRAYFECEHLLMWWQTGKHLLLLRNRKLHMVIRLTYLDLILAHSKDIGKDHVHCDWKYLYSSVRYGKYYCCHMRFGLKYLN